MTDRWSESLSDYLDGELTTEDRRELALHLESCADCAQALRELEQVVERARALPDLAPARDLWPAIETQLVGWKEAPAKAPAPIPARRARTRVVSFTWPQLMAAGLLVALLATAAFWLGTRGDRRMAHATPAASGEVTKEAATNAPPPEQAITELQHALASGREDLDPATVKVLEQNLASIERSIREAKAALDADPANPYLRRHLQETMTSKVNLIRQAAFLASAP
jgi:anti-sigma factor RsiW